MTLAKAIIGTAAVLAVAGLCGGCAVGPDFERPAAPAADYAPEPLPAATASADVGGGGEQKFASGAAISAQWWELFQSEPLNALI